ncbi:MAG TPA: hypothetical protein VHP63_05780 [candidate division Zixibacteria bacterium]|nr:hypothetical protein [candidate division Zixibacteria bacterium]
MSLFRQQFPLRLIRCIFLVFIAIGCSNNSEDKNSKNVASTKRELETEDKVIGLVKSAKIKDVWPDLYTKIYNENLKSENGSDLGGTIQQYSDYLELENLTVEQVVKDNIKSMKGVVKINGWKKKQFNETTYLVSFTFEEREIERGWYFEVVPTISLIRDISKDSTLWNHYRNLNSP